MANKNNTIDFTLKIKELLSEQLGVEAEEINEDDSLVDDLNMRAVDISDLFESLKNFDLDISSQDIEEVETVRDIIELVGSEGNL